MGNHYDPNDPWWQQLEEEENRQRRKIANEYNCGKGSHMIRDGECWFCAALATEQTKESV